MYINVSMTRQQGQKLHTEASDLSLQQLSVGILRKSEGSQKEVRRKSEEAQRGSMLCCVSHFVHGSGFMPRER
jgi:hypothetical protein